MNDDNDQTFVAQIVGDAQGTLVTKQIDVEEKCVPPPVQGSSLRVDLDGQLPDCN